MKFWLNILLKSVSINILSHSKQMEIRNLFTIKTNGK